MADKKVNYTPEMTIAIVSAYSANPNVETVAELATKFDRSIASIRAKLVREGVYHKSAYVGKTGETAIDKEKLADAIAVFIPAIDEASVSSLAKANKKALKGILKVITDLAEFKKKAMESFDNSGEPEFDVDSANMADEVANVG